MTDQASFLAAIKKSGLVGLGGAGFPTDIKLAPPNLEEIDLYVVNATECEPYLSTDYREMMESPTTCCSAFARHAGTSAFRTR